MEYVGNVVTKEESKALRLKYNELGCGSFLLEFKYREKWFRFVIK